MTVRNLNYLLQPGSVALIGASRRPDSPGARVLRNLREAGYTGTLFAVNPKYDDIDGLRCYPDVAALPQAPDLAVIVTPPRSVPRLVKALAARGTRAAVVITNDLGAVDGRRGLRRVQAMLNVGRSVNFRILGPGSLGVVVPGIGLNASCAHLTPKQGRLALVAQSGTVLTAMIDWATDKDIGFSRLVSLGGKCDVDFGDMLNYLTDDRETDAILLYIESLERIRKFMSASRAAARIKPVIVLKAGRSAASESVLVDRDTIFQAAFERAGLLRVQHVAELFDMAAILAHSRPPRGDRLAILTNSSGMGLLAVDALTAAGGQLAEPEEKTRQALAKLLAPTGYRGQPVDLAGLAVPEQYARAVVSLIDDRNVDALLILHCPVAGVDSLQVAEAVADSAGDRRKPVLTSWVGSTSMAGSRTLFAHRKIPDYPGPGDAIRVFMQMVRYRRNQELLIETPPTVSAHFECDTVAAEGVIRDALDARREWLAGREIRALLEAYAIPVVPTHHAADGEEAGQIAARLGEPVALKIASPDIVQKSEVGGVILDLQGPDQVAAVALGMETRLRQRFPRASIDGFTVQPMVRWPRALELVVGMVCDPLFGPVLVFGHGGTAMERIDDRSVALPPLNLKLARELIERTRVARLLAGYRDQPPADIEAVALTLLKLSRLVSDQTHVCELIINPLLASGRGVLAMDAQVRLSREPVAGAERLAIRPYPQELEEALTLTDGRDMLLRPIRAEDEPALHRFVQRLDPEDIRLRFHHPMKVMDHKLAARLTQLDYDRDMALALTDTAGDIHGVVRLSADPDRQRAEYAIIIARELSGMGLGLLLMRRIIDYARQQGIGELFGSVLNDNEAMLGLCRKLGFRRESHPEGSGLVLVRLDLHEPPGSS